MSNVPVVHSEAEAKLVDELKKVCIPLTGMIASRYYHSNTALLFFYADSFPCLDQ